jgi:predicted TPR repeat methyltransferase
VPFPQASERHVYDELLEGDIAEALSAYSGDGKSEKGAIGFILAADVFVYIGDLREIFAASIAALSPGGLFAFTVERLDDVAESARLLEANPVSEAPVSQEDYDKGWKLRFTGRFAHSRPYIVGLAEEYGFEVLVHENIVPRRDNGVDIQGHLVVLQKPN